MRVHETLGDLERFQRWCSLPVFYTGAKALCFCAPNTALKGRTSTRCSDYSNFGTALIVRSRLSLLPCLLPGNPKSANRAVHGTNPAKVLKSVDFRCTVLRTGTD